MRSLKHILGLVALVVALGTYTLCVQPTVPFWDCGEFTAATVQQQVPHPPGAPLFLMVGKLFHLVPIGDQAVRVNMVSVVASAVSVWLLYYILVMTLSWMRRSASDSDNANMLVYGSSLVGALAFCFSDTFWFNAVESEVYASSSLFVAIIVYLMMRWNEEADSPGHERFLLMIAYLIGLSTGVHLLSVLTIFSIGLIVYFRKYTLTAKSFMVMGALTMLVFAITYPGIVKYFPALLSGNLPWKNEALEYYVENEVWVKFVGIGIVVGCIAGAVIGVRQQRPLLSLACASFVAMFLGYTTYAHILVRANANPPMNENAPKTFKALISYLGREQYGDAPTFPRRFERDPDKVEAYKKYGPYTPPPTKHIESIRTPGASYSVPDYANAKGGSGDWNYLFRYQLDHMFLRYLLWNFMGRTSDAQDAEAWSFTTSSKYIEQQNFASGYESHFPVSFYGFPFLLGLFGMIQHFRRDWRMASVFMVMFLVMGVVAAFAQNQQEPQPRERDYFYTGAFMVWCLWIGVGMMSLVDILRRYTKNATTSIAVVTIGLVAVPGLMGARGWFIHSRAGNYLPFDYSYNILQSCEKDAILFTNGDNDTFPLWLLQDVYGIRRDIRIVNLSLAGTLWYIYDLKNLEPWGAKKIPLTFSDASLLASEYSTEALTTKGGPAEHLTIPLSASVRTKFGLTDQFSALTPMMWDYKGYARQGGQYAYSVPQQVIGDIVKQLKFERPVYFSITCGYPTSELYCGLGQFCRLEGMAYRVCPMYVGEPGEAVDFGVMDQCLLRTIPGDDYAVGPQYGSKFRNLSNPKVYYDETHRRYIDNYRTLFVRYANLCVAKGDSAKCIAVLDSMNSYISPDQFPISYALMMDVSDMYQRAGATTQSKAMAKRVFDQCVQMIEKPYLQARFPQFIDRMPPSMLASQSAQVLGDYNSAREYAARMRDETHDVPGYEFRIAKINAEEKEAQGDVKAAIGILRHYVDSLRATKTSTMFDQAILNCEEKIRVLEMKANP